MIVLSDASENEIAEFGRHLFISYRDSLATFEAAAQVCVRELYNTFRTQNDIPAFALVRLYRLCQFHELLPELQAIVNPHEDNRWMALFGTIGDEPAWCSRQQSKAHKAIVVGDRQSPMLSAAFDQLGLNNASARGNTVAMREASLMTRYFLVEKAAGSPHIPAQEAFVHRYGIESVIGLGSLFVSGAFYLALCFSKVRISQEDAQKFASLSSFISTLIATYDGKGALWN